MQGTGRRRGTQGAKDLLSLERFRVLKTDGSTIGDKLQGAWRSLCGEGHVSGAAQSAGLRLLRSCTPSLGAVSWSDSILTRVLNAIVMRSCRGASRAGVGFGLRRGSGRLGVGVGGRVCHREERDADGEERDVGVDGLVTLTVESAVRDRVDRHLVRG